MTKISLASRGAAFLGLVASLGLAATSSAQTNAPTVSLGVERTVAFLHNEDVLPSLIFFNAKEISAAVDRSYVANDERLHWWVPAPSFNLALATPTSCVRVRS